VKGVFRKELFTTTLHAARVVSIFQHKATSSVCVTMVWRAKASVWTWTESVLGRPENWIGKNYWLKAVC